MSKGNKTASRFTAVALLSSIVYVCSTNVSAVTNQFRGVNWADQRDNYVSGVIYVSGLSSSDTYSSASTVADKIISQFMAKLGTNSVKLPINEATVSQYWGTYTGAIDMALSKGRLVLCYWPSAHGASPANMTNFWNMWTTVVNKYGNNSNCYFEVYNEPNNYNKTELGNVYNEWLTRFSSVPRGRVILEGTGMAQNVPDIGSDSRFNGCLLAVHEYSMWGSDTWTTEAQWINHFKGYVGNYADRTICTEWGGPMSPGSKNGINYEYLDYSRTPTNYFEAYIRGITSQMRTWQMGSFYWIGLRDGDWYSMTTKSGSGANITLTVPNQSGLDRMKYSWTDTVQTSAAPSGTKEAPVSNLKVTGNGSLVRIELTPSHRGLTSLMLFDLSGNVVRAMSFQAGTGGSGARSFDCSGIPEGFYLVKLENKGGAILSPKVLVTR
jgi:hypothetical protein